MKSSNQKQSFEIPRESRREVEDLVSPLVTRIREMNLFRRERTMETIKDTTAARNLNTVNEDSFRVPFRNGVLRASTPVSENSFRDPLEHSICETREFNHHIKNHYCPRTYSRPIQRSKVAIDRLSDCNISLTNESVASVGTMHRRAEKTGRFRNIKRSFSKSTPSPVRFESAEEVLPDWLLFQSPKKPTSSEFKSPVYKKRRVLKTTLGLSKKRTLKLNKKRENKKKSKRGRLPIKIQSSKQVPPSNSGEINKNHPRSVYHFNSSGSEKD